MEQLAKVSLREFFMVWELDKIFYKFNNKPIFNVENATKVCNFEMSSWDSWLQERLEIQGNTWTLTFSFVWTLAFIFNLKGTFGGQCLELDLNHKDFSPLDTILQELKNNLIWPDLLFWFKIKWMPDLVNLFFNSKKISFRLDTSPFTGGWNMNDVSLPNLYNIYRINIFNIRYYK